jgi:hypothetical protein
MLKRGRLLAAAAAAILCAVGLASTGAVPAQAQTCCVEYDIYLYNTSSFIYAHAHNYPLLTTSNTAESQWWQLIRPATLNRINNQGTGTAYEVELENTGECFNNVPTEVAGDNIGIVELDSCVSGDLDEYYWPDPAASGMDYLRNVQQSYTYGNEYAYLTGGDCGGIGPESGEDIVLDLGPGCSTYAYWRFEQT